MDDKSTGSPSLGLPVVDFASFLDGTQEGKLKVGKEMVKIMKAYGFMYVINHGIAESDEKRMFEWSKAFFDMSEQQKMKCPHPADGANHRGYSSLGKEKVIQAEHNEEEANVIRKRPDIKESFDMGNNEHELYSNLWPSEADLPGFKEYCSFFWKICDVTSKNFLRAIALGLGLEEEYFLPFHDKSESSLRLLHYPPTDQNKLKSGTQERISAHTDFGTITLLLQDECGGLEVEDPCNKGTFIAAPHLKGSLVVNTGDCLQRWSNDTLKSTMHRVASPTIDSETQISKERYSIPFFVSANPDVVIDALPGTFSDVSPKKYEPVTAGDWLVMRLKALY